MFDHILRELRKLERGVQVSVQIELDDNGYLDRQCPSNECGTRFKVLYEDWRDIVRDEVVYCPLCRQSSTSTEWNTPEQKKQDQDTAIAYVQKNLGRAFQQDVRSFNSRQKRNDFIKMNMSYRPGHVPVPIPATATVVMTQEFQCTECNCRYSSIGAAFFCPSCGRNNILEAFENTIKTVKKTIDSIPTIRQVLNDSSDENVAEDAIRHICENALCKIVATFQKYAESCFYQLPNSEQFNVRRNLFQNLEESSVVWSNATSVGYEDILNAIEYQTLNKYFQQRHLLEHRDGIVDQLYIDRSNEHRFGIDQRLVVTGSRVSELASIVEKLSDGITALI